MWSVSIVPSGKTSTRPAYEPQNANVANRDRSNGGAQNLQMPWHDGYVTPCSRIRNELKLLHSFQISLRVATHVS